MRTKGLRRVVETRRLATGEVTLKPFPEAESRRLSEGRVRASLDQAAGGLPLAEGNRVAQGGTAADHGPGCFDVGTGVE